MLSRRTLRAMRDRWQKDLDRLEAVYVSADHPTMAYYSDSEHETVRNLASAIAEIEGLIAMARPGEQAPRPQRFWRVTMNS
jgi:hypothetical protein